MKKGGRSRAEAAGGLDVTWVKRIGGDRRRQCRSGKFTGLADLYCLLHQGLRSLGIGRTRLRSLQQARNGGRIADFSNDRWGDGHQSAIKSPPDRQILELTRGAHPLAQRRMAR